MLGLRLREEFKDRRLRGTAIELANDRNTGATQVPADRFLEITYPTTDVRVALGALAPQQGQPLVLIGERGQGKSHLLGALYHALTDSRATAEWLNTWAERLGDPGVRQVMLRREVKVICESLHKQHYKFLWDLLLEQHPAGTYIRGKWEGLGSKKTDVPPHDLILELLREQPAALLLDEFQTWFEGLTNTKQYPWRNWAFNFIQILTDIAKEHPELLVLVVSVRDGLSDAYQQVHRQNPIRVDFKGPNAERDRRRLLLHRLFENRLHVASSDIDRLIEAHVKEHLRLAGVPGSEQERRRRDFVDSWPFAPHLLQLLEDQVLVATGAQETRDLIRILVELYKRRGEKSPVLTAADFRIDDESSGIAALLDSVANEHHRALRVKALRNLTAVREAVADPTGVVPHLDEIVGALWLRSIAVENLAGADPGVLQADVTRDKPVDDNLFTAELAAIEENSFNIHKAGRRLVFREEENPQAKLMAHARIDRLFQDGEDRKHLAKEIRYVLSGSDEMPSTFRVVVLQRAWQTNPWGDVDEKDHPDRWDDRLPYVVLPEEPDDVNLKLGTWLRTQVNQRRNTIRFLVPRSGHTHAFFDRSLLILARVIVKAQEWQRDNPEYVKLQKKYQTELRDLIMQRFDRYAVLRVWSYTDPGRCRFQVERIAEQGQRMLEAIERALLENVFVQEDFETLVHATAERDESIAKLMHELQEPRPGEANCVPWLGEMTMKEKVVRLCARGLIAIDLRGREYLQVQPGEEAAAAWLRMRGRLGTGKHLEETRLLLPHAVPPAAGGGNQPGLFGGPSAPGEPGVVPAGPIPGSNDPTLPAPGSSAAASSGPGTGASRGATLSCSPTSPLDLLGKIEAWGIRPASALREVTLKVDRATGAQIEKLIKNLPDGVTCELNLVKEE